MVLSKPTVVKLRNVRIPFDVREAMDILRRHGYEAYLVGGCVRDLILGIEPNDYDVVTNARPEEVLTIFERLGWIVVPKGIEYGVVSVVNPVTRREIEIATYRKEFYAQEFNRRSAVVEFANSLAEDVARRDFTINALAMDENGDVIDYVGGLEDLKKGIIRFVGNPDERIREDPLRMLRALRFAAKLGFRIDPKTLEAIKRNTELIKYVSWERIGDEIVKAAKTNHFALFVKLLYETGLYKYILPELGEMARTRHGFGEHHRGETVLEHTLEVLERLDKMHADYVTKLAALLHDVAKPITRREMGGKVTFYGHEVAGAKLAEKILRRWRRPSKLIEEVKEIIRAHMEPLTMAKQGLDARKIAAKLVAKHGKLAINILELAMADAPEYAKLFSEAIRYAKEMLSKPKPLVSGYEVMKLYGVKPGPEVGKIKNALYEIQLRYGLKSKKEVIERACKELGICPKTEIENKNKS